MMSLHYNFPIIESINDVLPHIAGRPEFIVAKKDGYQVVNYVMSNSETFNGATPEQSAILRECRGLVFGEDGKVLSRRYHKFFNHGERGDQEPDFCKPHVILEKLDGSMISPIWINGEGFRWTTKMGITDVAMQAEVFVANHPDYTELARMCHVAFADA
jgi:RNA ligase